MAIGTVYSVLELAVLAREPAFLRCCLSLNSMFLGNHEYPGTDCQKGVIPMASYQDLKFGPGHMTSKKVTCPSCKTNYVVAGKHSGKTLDCSCGTKFTV